MRAEKAPVAGRRYVVSRRNVAHAGIEQPAKLARLDRRTREGRRLQEIQRDLLAGIGGEPTPAQKYLIERTAVDLLRLELYDVEMALGTLSDHGARVCHALRNTVRLALRDLHGLGRQRPEKYKVDPVRLTEVFPGRRRAS